MYRSNAVTPNVKRRQAIEVKIIFSLIDELLAHGFALSVFDGEDETEPSQDRQAVIDAIYNTDNDTLNVHKDGEEIGWIALVYGNDGFDVISDYTTNLESFFTSTRALADRIEQGKI